jgi:hypothetical protein
MDGTCALQDTSQLQDFVPWPSLWAFSFAWLKKHLTSRGQRNGLTLIQHYFRAEFGIWTVNKGSLPFRQNHRTDDLVAEVIFEQSSSAGSFFRRFPVHRMLISGLADGVSGTWLPGWMRWEIGWILHYGNQQIGNWNWTIQKWW